jgi:predicted nucleic acid-binding protein
MWHAAAIHFLRHSLENDRVVICDYVLLELYNLLRNPAVMQEPIPAAKAVAIVTRYLKFPAVMRAENAPIMDEVWKIAARPSIARRRVFDLRLGLTLRHHGVTHFATANTKDFKGLGFERVWNPLIG